MDYAIKSLSLLSPKSLSRQVAVSTSVVTQQLLSKPGQKVPRARPCRVSTADRRVRKGLTAHSLKDLFHKVRHTLALRDEPLSLVLEEDGTAVETEEYFQALSGNTAFMVLRKGQKWQPPSEQRSRHPLGGKPARKIGVARLTFDLHKLSPQDFPGCLTVRATLYDTYSLSCDLHCHRAARMLREVLRLALFTMRATGHMLLGTAGYMQQLLDATEEGQLSEAKSSSFIPTYLKILQ
ncbi:lipid transferase CIDEC isoform 1-T1 [Ctenodactylus gundi]